MSRRISYRFNCDKFDDQYNNDTCQYVPTTFYQVCTFPNPITCRYSVAKYKIDCNNQMEKKVFDLSSKSYNRFIKEMPRNKYNIYDSYTLDMVPAPSLNDIDTSRSELLQ